jgi:hypothetical protein
MGIQVLPHLGSQSHQSRLQVVGGREANIMSGKRADLAIHIATALPEEKEDQLGCIRGIFIAICIQATAVIIGVALWRLLH